MASKGAERILMVETTLLSYIDHTALLQRNHHWNVTTHILCSCYKHKPSCAPRKRVSDSDDTVYSTIFKGSYLRTIVVIHFTSK